MDTQILTQTLKTLRLTFEGIPSNLEGTALWLLSALTVIDIGLLIFKVDEIDWIKTLCRKAFKIGLLMFIITNYTEGLTVIMDSFTSIGAKAIGVFDEKFINNPSELLTMVFNLAKPLYNKAGIFSKSGWVFNVIILTMYFCGIAIAFQVFVTWLEFFALTGITIIFIPFATLDKTAFIAEKAFGVILGLGVKLMILALMVGSSVGILSTLSVPPDVDILISLHLLSIMISIMYLIWKAPSLAASMMTGNPNLSGGDMVGLISRGSSMVGAAVGTVAGGLINMGLGSAGKESLGQMFGGGKAHTAGKVAGNIGGRIKSGTGSLIGKLRGSNGGSESPTAPGGKENSHEHQSSKSSDSGSALGGDGSKGSSGSPNAGSSSKDTQGSDSQTPSGSDNSPGGSQESNTSSDTGTQQNDKGSETSPGTTSTSSANNSSPGGTSKPDTGTKQNSEKSDSPGGSKNNQSDTSKVQLNGRTYNMPKDTGKKVNGIEIPSTPGKKE